MGYDNDDYGRPPVEVIAVDEHEEPDEFQLMAPSQHLSAIFSMLGTMVLKFGGQVDFTPEDFERIGGCYVNVLHNPRRHITRLKLNDPQDSIWNKATPGIEPGHA